MSRKPALILGAGGHARTLIGVLRRLGYPIAGATAMERSRVGLFHHGVKIFGDDSSVLDRDPSEVVLVNAIGLLPARQEIFAKFKDRGYEFLTLVDPSAVKDESVGVGEGSQIQMGTVLQTCSHIGLNCIVNTGALVEHDVEVGDHTHIAPGAIICGGVTIGSGCFIGAGTVVRQGLHIGAGATVGAGSVVVKDVPGGVVSFGHPAKIRA